MIKIKSGQLEKVLCCVLNYIYSCFFFFDLHASLRNCKDLGTVVTCLFKGLLHQCFVCACYKHIHVGIRLGVHVEEICAPRRCFLSEIELCIPNIFLRFLLNFKTVIKWRIITDNLNCRSLVATGRHMTK